ncbi:MAG TPA: hypothetical protein VMT52_11145 [Planctomycetota bacterium]|nr:hypothetical protein [Planctomycetota bacterium]
MKAVGFFASVFLSMLVVFLLATGEVQRWFSTEERAMIEPLGVVSRGSTSPAKNLLEFPFYDVEKQELKFDIKAEFSQEEIQVDTPLEDIPELTLRNGVIHIPLPGDASAVPAGAGGVEDRKKKMLVLEFKTALYRRSEKTAGGKTPFEVLLRDGKGVSDDGSELSFEDLVFSEDASDSFRLRSSKPASIRSAGFSVMSPSGFEGEIKERGARTFTFLPPVSAVIDASQSALIIGREQSPGGNETAPGGKIGITCQGPLTLVSEDAGSQKTDEQPAKTSIRFQQDIVIYPVDTAPAESLPPMGGTRFECQELHVEIRGVGGKSIPVRALATHPGGRVKALFEKEKGAGTSVIDGDRLEWILDIASSAEGEVPGASRAVLHGSPTLRGKGIVLNSERAVFHIEEARIRLESVRGTLDSMDLGSRGAGRTRTDADPRAIPPRIDRWSGDEGLLVKGPGKLGGRRTKPAGAWDMSADEADIFFAKPEGTGATNSGDLTLSKLVARSRSADGVELRNRTSDEERAKAGGSRPEETPFHARGASLTYTAGDQRVIVEGSSDLRPRFAQGENWIEARRIHVLPEEGTTVWFEDDVHGIVEDAASLRGAARALRAQEDELPSSKDAAAHPSPDVAGRVGKEDSRVEPARNRAGGPIALDAASFEISANFLAAHFDAEKELRDIVARGKPGAPVRLTVNSGGSSTIFVGPELYWEEERAIGQLSGASSAGGEATSAAGDSVALVQFKGGELAATRILFDQKSWKAYLSDQVKIVLDKKAAPSSPPALEVLTGKAEVQFFQDFQKGAVERSGALKELDFIKGFHAWRSAATLIELRTRAFTGRAEEAVWDSAARELRFKGSQPQEIEIVDEGFHGPTRAREVLYDEARNIIILRGDVTGRLEQLATASSWRANGAAEQLQPVSHAGSPKKSSVFWTFETSLLEVQLRNEESSDAPLFDSLRARDKVDLKNETWGIQLRGDDLTYDGATRKVHIFSPDGRPQTLIREEVLGEAQQAGDAPRGGAADPALARTSDGGGEKLSKIVAQEIWLLHYENPHAVAARGERREWLLIQFDRDVIGSFVIPPQRGERKKVEGMGETWRIVAEKLTLRIDPDQAGEGAAPVPLARRKLVPWALASGKVVLTSGSYQATADRAVYEELQSQITLYGSPARLLMDNKEVFSENIIMLRKLGETVGLSYEKGTGFPPQVPDLRAPGVR